MWGVCVCAHTCTCMHVYVCGGEEGVMPPFSFPGLFIIQTWPRSENQPCAALRLLFSFFPLLLHLNTSYRTSSHAFFFGDRSGKKGGSGRWHTGTVQQQRGAVLSDKLLEPRHPGQDVLALWVGHQANSGLGC